MDKARFFSDNAAPVHPAVWDAMRAADEVDTAYDGDRWSGRLNAHVQRPVRGAVPCVRGGDGDGGQLPVARCALLAAPRRAVS